MLLRAPSGSGSLVPTTMIDSVHKHPKVDFYVWHQGLSFVFINIYVSTEIGEQTLSGDPVLATLNYSITQAFDVLQVNQKA